VTTWTSFSPSFLVPVTHGLHAMWFIVFYADTYRVERVKNDKQVLYNIVYKYMYGGIK